MISEKETPANWSSHAVARSNVIFDPHPVEDVMERPPRPPKPVLSDGVGAEKRDPLPPVERSRHAHKSPAE
jgi:hypothetical protein